MSGEAGGVASDRLVQRGSGRGAGLVWWSGAGEPGECLPVLDATGNGRDGPGVRELGACDVCLAERAAMKSRRDGYYWVRHKTLGPTVAQWAEGSGWNLPGWLYAATDEDMKEIDERRLGSPFEEEDACG